jgi:hypothetical protein
MFFRKLKGKRMLICPHEPDTNNEILQEVITREIIS